METGLGRFVKLDKPQDFPGKAALRTETAPSRCLVTLVVDPSQQDAPYMAAAFHKGIRVGEVLSAAYGYRTEKAIALAMVATDATAPGTELEVEVYGQRLKAVVQENPCLWDADNSRIRA
jgi:dimethylglycine dehydrogenase